MNRDPVIVSAVRTPIGRQGGAFASIPAHVLGAIALKEAIARIKLEVESIDDVIFGNVIGGGGNIARLTALEAGLPLTIPGLTIDRQCGSGLNAINLAAQAIKAGDGDVYVVGGAESMSQAPYLMEKPSKPYSTMPPRFMKSRLSPDEIGDPPMGITAENLAEKYEISREEQDEFAHRSQERMGKAMAEGYFDSQIASVSVPVRKGNPIVVSKDEHPRPETTLEKLATLPPAFKKGGTVTAGSSSGLNDAASAVIVMSREKAEDLGLKPLAIIKAYAVSGVDPNIMGIGPVPATRRVMEQAGLSLEDMDLIEVNEAFAAQVLACDRELNMNTEKLNVNGGAISHGHPLGATGAILATKAIYELERRDGKYALVTACIGGGQGIATILERV
ncbi:thiolase family protein [Pseudalkalibacillus hwajinpoensis]|uniref:acetyl-CoA C-acetyltransferase n=1 Tax=Guptibacillus hwajinpoensis TaxID=208199 RepID=A0A4U1MJL1_9BACL|nr:thiolase family protein [Pseudalkalibacillus hwajinpoensis]TKD71283.1 thiolase family protein [Pseudalkalibacillus hwajinpoensis]